MIGIVLWAILILFIVTCACPGYWTALLIISASYLVFWFLIKWLFSQILKILKK